MKGFNEFLSEAKGKKTLKDMGAPKGFPPQTICGLMTGTEKNFLDWWAWYASGDVMYPPGEEGKFYRALMKWFEMEGGSKGAVISTLMKAVNCPGRKPWAAYGGGTVYRGVPRLIGKTGVTFPDPKIVKHDHYGERMAFITGVTKYQSKYAMQSWSPVFKSSINFAINTDRKAGKQISGAWVPLVFEMKVGKEDTFLNPKLCQAMLVLNPMLGDAASADEFEVIRTVNPAVEVKVYVGHDMLNTHIGMAVAKDPAYKSFKDLDAVMEKHLTKWFGSQSAKKLVPLIRKPVQVAVTGYRLR